MWSGAARTMVRLVTILVAMCVGLVCGYPQQYDTTSFTAGIKYDSSIPMSGGSDRLRHRGSNDPFFVTVAVTAKSDYVIDYIEVTATVDAGADVTFCLLQGQPGTAALSFQLSSNGSDFLAYSYRSYGLWAEEYQKYAQAAVGRPGNC